MPSEASTSPSSAVSSIAASPASATGSGSGTGSGSYHNGQDDGEHAALAGCGVHLNRAFHLLHRKAHEGKSDACADALRVVGNLIERLKDVLLLLRGKTDARVAHAEHEVAPVGAGG